MLKQIDLGTSVTMFSAKKVERKTLAIKKDTMKIIWTIKPAIPTRVMLEDDINVEEIKEVRLGKFSKDFERWPGEAEKFEMTQCFAVLYGNKFNLKVLSIACYFPEECNRWVHVIRDIIKERMVSPHPLQIQVSLNRDIDAIKCPKGTIDLKGLKTVFPNIDNKIPINKLKQFLSKVNNEIKYELTMFYHTVIIDNASIRKIFDKIQQYSANGKTVNLQEFESFLIDEQGDFFENDDRSITQLMCNYLSIPKQHKAEPYMTIVEFIDYLFSKQNDLWNPKKDIVYQDMSKPLSHYWINSSHNTYLTGDQFSSESSTEAYVRCLRMGCRCIELDCWDGSDGIPVIHHGHTLTTKINFFDVIKVIKMHAFATSYYPVILSIEDHCSLSQQRKMATIMQEAFGDMLLNQPIDKNETILPSPHSLRRKILLKHKCFLKAQHEHSLVQNNISQIDMNNSEKSGIIYLKNQSHEWAPFFFILTQNMLIYTNNSNLIQEAAKSTENHHQNFPTLRKSFSNEDLNVTNKRSNSIKGLEQRIHLGVGMDNNTEFMYSYVKEEDAPTSKPLRRSFSNYELQFNDYSLATVPNEELHLGEEWFHGKLNKNKQKAEQLLRTHSYLGDGAFLVRESETYEGKYCLSFLHQGKIKHCRINSIQHGNQTYYHIKNEYFESLYNLINYYRKHLLVAPNFSVVLQKAVPHENVYENEIWFHTNTTRVHAEEILMSIGKEGDFLVRQSENQPKCVTISFRAYRKVFHYRITYKAGFYSIRNKEFENLTPLIKYYQVYPLFRDVKLINPISEEMGYRYKRKAVPIIHRSVDLKDIRPSMYHDKNQTDMEWIIQIRQPVEVKVIELGFKSQELAVEWIKKINEVTDKLSISAQQNREMEEHFHTAKELSNLIIYCRAVTFNIEKAKKQDFEFNQMSSFSENKAEKLICQQEMKFFLKYHQVQLSRVYPKPQRIDSSNFNPMKFWNCGSQMVALNFQTGDKPMQVNLAKFRDNGNCGYILKPDFMLLSCFDPCSKMPLLGVTPLKLSVSVIAARHLCPLKNTNCSPYVILEVIGAPFDSGVKLWTKSVPYNGFNPIWTSEKCSFVLYNPNFAMIRFLVKDGFGKVVYNIGQATYPVNCLRKGYRSVRLKNAFSEDLDLATLLVHLNMTDETFS